MDHNAPSSPLAQIRKDPVRGWRCSACAGYLRPDAETCKHCGALLRLPDPDKPGPVSPLESVMGIATLAAAFAAAYAVLPRGAGPLGVAAAWTAGITVLVIGSGLTTLKGLPAKRWQAPRHEGAWIALPLLWLGLMAVCTLPAVVWVMLTPLIGWGAPPVALSLSGTVLCALVWRLLAEGPSIDRVLAQRAAERPAESPSVDLALVQLTARPLSVRRIWLGWHLALVVPLAVISWVGAVWGPQAKTMTSHAYALLLAIGGWTGLVDRLFGRR